MKEVNVCVVSCVHSAAPPPPNRGRDRHKDDSVVADAGYLFGHGMSSNAAPAAAVPELGLVMDTGVVDVVLGPAIDDGARGRVVVCPAPDGLLGGEAGPLDEVVAAAEDAMLTQVR